MIQTNNYISKVLYLLDESLAVVVLDAHANETISAYVGRKYMGRWPQKLIDWIIYRVTGQKNHCLHSFIEHNKAA